MSFYDDASLIMYPSGYKEDKIYSLKPTNGTGDLTFTRASSATRVNAEGLIEEASVLGSELITNGDFATDTSWSKGTGWSISGGSANCDGTQTGNSNLTQGSVFSTLANKDIKISFTVSNYVAGSVRFISGNGALTHTAVFVNGVVTLYFNVGANTGTTFNIQGDSSFIGSIDNVSVKEVITSNVPRIDYTGGGCGSLLLEKQSTNLVTYSEAFDNAAWTKVNATITANATTSPDGTQNASTLVISSSGYLLRQFTAQVLAGGSWALSIFAKNQITTFLRFGGATPSGTDTYSIQDMGNGWYRHFLVRTFASANASFNLQYLIGEVGTNYIYGAQVEEGSYATSYIISNSGTTTTRIADAASKTGLSSLINDSEGVLYAEVATNYDSGLSRRITLSDGTISNRISFEFDEAVENTLKVFVDGTTLTYSASNLSVLNKIAFKYKAGDHQLYFNGVEVATSASASIPTGLNQLSFDGGNGSNDFYGNVQNLMVFPSALTDDELADLTGAVHQTFNSLATFYNYTIL